MVYRNHPFFVMEIFSDSTCYPIICYTNIIPVEESSPWNFLFVRWLMVIPSIDNGNSIPDTRVSGLFGACQSSPTAATCLSIFVHIITKDAAKYLYFSSLGGSVP